MNHSSYPCPSSAKPATHHLQLGPYQQSPSSSYFLSPDFNSNEQPQQQQQQPQQALSVTTFPCRPNRPEWLQQKSVNSAQFKKFSNPPPGYRRQDQQQHFNPQCQVQQQHQSNPLHLQQEQPQQQQLHLQQQLQHYFNPQSHAQQQQQVPNPFQRPQQKPQLQQPPPPQQQQQQRQQQQQQSILFNNEDPALVSAKGLLDRMMRCSQSDDPIMSDFVVTSSDDLMVAMFLRKILKGSLERYYDRKRKELTMTKEVNGTLERTTHSNTFSRSELLTERCGNNAEKKKTPKSGSSSKKRRRRATKNFMNISKKIHIDIKNLAKGYNVFMIQGCCYCASSSHNSEDCKVQQPRCPYPLCAKPTTHLIQACTYLQARCLFCDRRGHRKRECEVNAHVPDYHLTLARHFDDYRAQGYYTKQFFDVQAKDYEWWGFEVGFHLREELLQRKPEALRRYYGSPDKVNDVVLSVVKKDLGPGLSYTNVDVRTFTSSSACHAYQS